MSNALRSHFASSVVGGLVVAGGFLLLGLNDRPRTRTIVEQAPVAAVTGTGGISGLTPNAIYQRDAPGVVHVRAKPNETVESPFNLFHQGQSSISTGSGFLVDRRGDILTAYHVVAGADPTGVTVGFEGGVTRVASVAGVDQEADLAVLRVDLHGVPSVRPLPLGDSTTVRVGDPTLALGNPYGADRTLSSGIVSALQHQIEAADGSMVDNVIQTDQQLDPSSSGGPLLDAGGRVIGINSQLAGTSGDGSAISFATPINTADAVLVRVRAGATVRLAYIGLKGVSSGHSRSGVTVTRVIHNGPAAGAGLRPGDSIEKLDGITVSSMSELSRQVMVRTPGQTVSLAIRRNGHVRALDVRLGSPPLPRP